MKIAVLILWRAVGVLLLITLALVLLILVSCYTESQPLSREEEPAIIGNIIWPILTDLIHHEYDSDVPAPGDNWRATQFLRDTHPKANGCLQADFTVEPDLPDSLRIGVFKGKANGERTYESWIRFSNAANEITHDSIKDFRGMVMKLFDVQGEKLPVPGDERNTQDFFFIAHDAFFAGNPLHFRDFFAACRDGGYTCDPRQNPRIVWWLLTHPSGAWNSIVGRKTYNSIEDINWFTVAPFLLQERGGDSNVVKYSVLPCSEEGGAWSEPGEGQNYLMERLKHRLDPSTGRGICLNFNIQFRTNPRKQPINSTLIAWDSTDSPWTKVATINIYPQEFDTPERWQFCQNMTFNPGHSLWEHRHIEGLNRARVRVMHAMQEIRLHRNELQRFEPTGNEVFYPGATFPWLRPPRRAAGRFE